MGLDMYLFSAPKIEGLELNEILRANIYLLRLEKENNELYLKVKDYVQQIEEFGHTRKSLLTEVMYWRKANHIHYWFVENVFGGKDESLASSEVTKQQIFNLCRHCDIVLNNETKANEFLPTMSGPFFGSLNYDSFYFEETKRTHDELRKLLISPDFFEKNYLLYQCSW